MTEAVTWAEIKQNAALKSCSKCGVELSCGRALETCWCVSLPPLPKTALNEAADCLCPACLGEATKGRGAR